MTTQIVGRYAVDEPGRSPRSVRADGPLEAAREVFGGHVTIRAVHARRWDVLNAQPPLLPQRPDGGVAKIGTVYLIDED